jgi:hypothetical protein
MKSIHNAIKAAEDAIKEVNQELNKLDMNKTDPIYERQLIEILEYLKLMNRKLTGEEPITNMDKYGFGLGRMIVDSWSYDNPIGPPIIRAEEKFIKAIK